MKRALVVIFTLTMVLSLAACDKKTETASAENSGTGAVETVQPDQETAVPEEKPEQKEPGPAADEGWKAFLKDYEAWVDSYVEATKKYQENPSDITLLSEYTKLLGQVAEWAEKADTYKEELEAAPEMLAEYLKTMERILEKLSSVA